MPRVHVTGGYLNVDTFSPEGPVDPGFGGGIGAGHPGNALPPGFPPIGSTLPEPPVGIWPPPTWGNPIVPIIDNTLPVQPGTIWPSPGRPPHIDAGLPRPPAHVGGGPMPGNPPTAGTPLPTPPGQIDNALPSRTFWMIAYCPSLGWKYIAVDPSLEVGMPLPPAPTPKG